MKSEPYVKAIPAGALPWTETSRNQSLLVVHVNRGLSLLSWDNQWPRKQQIFPLGLCLP